MFGCIVLLEIGVGQTHAILRRSDRSEAEYVALAERYPSVCAVGFDDRLAGSGTLIAPRWVLTAAHVIDLREKRDGEWVLPAVEKKWFVLFNQSLQVPVKRIIEYPGYFRKAGGFDVALLELDHAVEGIAPIPCYAGSQELGQQITVVGFGGQGTIESGPPRNTAAVKSVNMPARLKVKWAGTDVVIYMTDMELVTQVDRPETMTELEAVFAGGDSGGPTLISVNGQAMVAGVVGSGAGWPPGTDPNSPYGRRNAFSRVSYAARWIEDTTGADFGVVRYERPLAVGLLALFCGVGAWVLRRKRRRNEPIGSRDDSAHSPPNRESRTFQ